MSKIINDVVNVVRFQGAFFTDEALARSFVLKSQRHGKIDFKFAAVEKHEQFVGCSVLRPQSRDKYVGVDNYRPFCQFDDSLERERRLAHTPCLSRLKENWELLSARSGQAE